MEGQPMSRHVNTLAILAVMVGCGERKVDVAASVPSAVVTLPRLSS